MLWILKLSLPSCWPKTKRVFQNLSAQIVATWGQFQEEGARACQPLVARSGHVHLKTCDQNHDFSDSTQKRGRMAGQIWFVQHVSWMQGREGVAVMVCTTDVYCPEPGEKPCNCARKVVEKAIFLLSWKRLKGDRKFTILVLGLSSRPIGI